jgi:hypothetical protein
MIANSIDGSVGGANQLLDLLSLVSNPDVYAERLKVLEASTAENKKYVELVAPASDILALRDLCREDREAAAQELKQANTDAELIKSRGTRAANAAIEAAKARAAEISADAATKQAQVLAELAEATAAVKAAGKAEAEAKRATTELKKAKAAAETETAAALMAKDEAATLKLEIIAKHKAFIESL